MFVEPAHVGQCSDDDETGLENLAVMELDQYARDLLVGNLEL